MLPEGKKEFSFQQEVIGSWPVGFRGHGGNEPSRGVEYSSFLKWNYQINLKSYLVWRTDFSRERFL